VWYNSTMKGHDEVMDEDLEKVIHELVNSLLEADFMGVQTGLGSDAVGGYRYVTFHRPMTLDGEIRVYSPGLILFRVNPSKRKNHLCASVDSAMKYIKEEFKCLQTQQDSV